MKPQTLYQLQRFIIQNCLSSGAQKHGPIQLKCEMCKYATNTTTINEKLLVHFDIKYVSQKPETHTEVLFGQCEKFKHFG